MVLILLTGLALNATGILKMFDLPSIFGKYCSNPHG